MLYEKGHYSDFTAVINNGVYKLHKQFVLPHCEYYAALFNFSKNNIVEKIIIKDPNDDVIPIEVINSIVKWFYHLNFDLIPILAKETADINFDFNLLLKYYYVADFLQIKLIVNRCLLLMNSFMDAVKKENYRLVNKDNRSYKFINDNNYVDIEYYRDNFNLIVNKIFGNVFNRFTKESSIHLCFLDIKKENNNQSKLICEPLTELFDSVNSGNINQTVDKIYNSGYTYIRSIMACLKEIVDYVYDRKIIDTLPLNNANISLNEFKVLINKVDKLNKATLIKFIRFSEFDQNSEIADYHQINTLNKICKNNELLPEFNNKIGVHFKYIRNGGIGYTFSY